MTMGTRTLLVLVVLLLTACDTDLKPLATKNDLSGVKGLEDCKVWTGYIEGRRVVIVRCPNSATSTMHQSGKMTVATVVIER